MRLVFMGTPDFSVPSLEALLDDGHTVSAVFTRPDRPRGRGLALSPSPVKALALDRGIPVHQPESFRDRTHDELLRALMPECIVVVAYGRILPPSVLDIPPLGCVNVHASLLPKYRGAAPIQRAVAAGERETGVTTMYLAPGMDTGDMIYMAATPIGADDTAGSMHDRLMTMGAELLVRTLRDIRAGTAPRTPQDHGAATYAPPISRQDARIDWSLPASEVAAFIRGMSPVPGAWTQTSDGVLKVFFALPSGKAATGRTATGGVVGAGRAGVEVCCGDGQTVLLTEVQGKGGRRMKASDYARGHKIEI